MNNKTYIIISIQFLIIGLLFGAMYSKDVLHEIELKHIYRPINDTLCDTSVLYWLNKFNVAQPEIVLKQAKLETGNYTSRRCLEDNNLFGLKRFSTGEYFVFNHWIESIALYRWTIGYKYNGGCYYEFLDSLPYASDTLYTYKLKQF